MRLAGTTVVELFTLRIALARGERGHGGTNMLVMILGEVNAMQATRLHAMLRRGHQVILLRSGGTGTSNFWRAARANVR